MLLQPVPGAGDGALADAVGAGQLGLRGVAEQRKAGKAEIALSLVVDRMPADRVGVQEVDDAVAVAEHADAGVDGRGVAGLEREGGGQPGGLGERGRR